MIAIAIGKYLDHLPFERMTRQITRDGLNVDSQTLIDQLWELQRIVKPAYEQRRGARNPRRG